MIPIASEVFWGPMAYAIIGGLFVATLLTLLFQPARARVYRRRVAWRWNRQHGPSGRKDSAALGASARLVMLELEDRRC
jgi:hypothetical protein